MYRGHRQHGFTIIEFMVAIGLLSVLMLAVTSSFTFQQRTYIVTDQVAEAKQNVRVLADLIERDIRNAGYMMPRTGAVCGVDDTVNPDKLYISDYSTVVALNALPANMLTTPLGADLNNSAAAGSGGSKNLFVDRLDIDGLGGGSDFVVGGGLIVADRNGATTSVACGTITAIGNPALPAIPLSVDLENGMGPMSPGTDLVVLPAIVYEILNGALLRNGQVIVNNVEDLQVAWFFDLNDDRTIDPGEMIADGVGGADAYDPENLDATRLREIRVNLVVRTRDQDPNDSWRQGIGQALENRTAASVAPQDGARRRVHSATVRLRNSLS